MTAAVVLQMNGEPIKAESPANFPQETVELSSCPLGFFPDGSEHPEGASRRFPEIFLGKVAKTLNGE